MRKVYYLLCFLFFGTVASAQVLTQSFDGTTFPPAGWLNTLTSTGDPGTGDMDGDVWQRVTVEYNEAATITPHSGAGMAFYDSYEFNVSSSATLTTPQLNFSTGGPYRVRFWTYRSATYPNRDSIDVFVNTSTSIATATKIGSAKRLISESPAIAAPGWYEYTFNIPASFNTASNYIFFQAIGMYGLNLFLDDIVVEAIPSCGTATGLTNSAATTSSLTYTWAVPSAGTAVDYAYELRTAGAAGSGASGLIASGTTAALTTTLSSLTAGTTYQFYLKTNCTASQVSTFSAAAIGYTRPSNDDCTGAIQVTASVAVSGTTLGATQSQAGQVCLGYTGNANDDVWYKFTTTQAGAASFKFTPVGTTFDAVMLGYSGACGALTLTNCADATVEGGIETLSFTGLTAGQTYYFRLYDYGSGSEGAFGIVASGAALPVSITNFKGERQSSNNTLSWITTTEINNAGFELQRSVDGVNFSSLTFVASKASNGNSNGSLNYSFNDKVSLAATYYYRLKQIDKDGKSTLSSVVFIKGTKSTKLEMVSIYPNPAVENLNVSIASPKSDKITFIVSDLAGKVIIRQSANVVSGDNNIQLNVGSLAKGTYTVKAVCADGCETAINKFIKQ